MIGIFLLAVQQILLAVDTKGGAAVLLATECVVATQASVEASTGVAQRVIAMPTEQRAVEANFAFAFSTANLFLTVCTNRAFANLTAEDIVLVLALLTEPTRNTLQTKPISSQSSQKELWQLPQ
jgi:hypothetical protein